MEDKVDQRDQDDLVPSSVCKVHDDFTETLAASCLMAGYGVFVLLVLLLRLSPARPGKRFATVLTEDTVASGRSSGLLQSVR
jgi:hypothetical protein